MSDQPFDGTTIAASFELQREKQKENDAQLETICSAHAAHCSGQTRYRSVRVRPPVQRARACIRASSPRLALAFFSFRGDRLCGHPRRGRRTGNAPMRRRARDQSVDWLRSSRGPVPLRDPVARQFSSAIAPRLHVHSVHPDPCQRRRVAGEQRCRAL